MRERRLGAIRLSSGPDSNADPAAIAAALLEGVRDARAGAAAVERGGEALRQRARVTPGVAIVDEALLDALDEWLPPLLDGQAAARRDRAGRPDRGAARADRLGRRCGDRPARARRTSPARAGSTHAIDYAAEGGPAVELRVQALFGLAEHPMIGAARVRWCCS